MAVPRYRALLIGNAVFRRDPQGLPRLQGPRADVDALCEALADSESGMFTAEDIEPLIDRNLQSLREELYRFFITDADRDDVLFLYYSGHGKLDLQSRLHLCANDTRVSALRVTALQYKEDIDALIKESPAASTVTILDCCHSGAFRGGELKVKATGKGRCVITSASANELALDSVGPGGTSPFTSALVTGLRFAQAHGHLTAQDLYDYVETELSPAGNAKPQFYFDGEGSIVLAQRQITVAPATDNTLRDRKEQRAAPIADQLSEPTSGAAAQVVSTEPASDVPQTLTGPILDGRMESAAFELTLPEPRSRLWKLLNEAASSTMPANDDDLPRIAALSDIIKAAAKLDPKWPRAVVRRLGEGQTRQTAVEALVSGLAEHDTDLALEHLMGLSRSLTKAEYVGGCVAFIEATPESRQEIAMPVMLEAISNSLMMAGGLQAARVLIKVMRIFAESADRSSGENSPETAERETVLHRTARGASQSLSRLKSRFEVALSDLLTGDTSPLTADALQAHIAVGLSEFNPDLAHGYFRVEGRFLPLAAFASVSSAEVATAAAAMLRTDPRTAYSLFEIAEFRCRAGEDWTLLLTRLLDLVEMTGPEADHLDQLLQEIERISGQVPAEGLFHLMFTVEALAATAPHIAERLMHLDPDEHRVRTGLMNSAKAATASDPAAAKRMAVSAERLVRSLTDENAQLKDTVPLADAFATLDSGRAVRLVQSMPAGNAWRFQAATAVATVFAATAPHRIDKLVRAFSGAEDREACVASVIKGIAKVDPAWAISLAEPLHETVLKSSALAVAAISMIDRSVALARDIADGIGDPGHRALAIAAVAKAIAKKDPVEGAELAMGLPDGRQSLGYKASALVVAGDAAAAKGLRSAAGILEDAEAAARRIPDERIIKPKIMCEVAAAFTEIDSGRATRLLADAERLALDFGHMNSDSRTSALNSILVAWASLAPGRAERMVNELSGHEWYDDDAVRTAITVMAPTDPLRAERLAGTITDDEQRCEVLLDLVVQLGDSSPARAERLALELPPGAYRARALLAAAEALHRRQSRE